MLKLQAAIRFTVFAAIVMVMTSPCSAQSPEMLAAAEKLVAVENDSLRADRAVDEALGSLQPSMQKAMTASNVRPELVTKVSAIVLDSLARHLTLDELTALTELYTDPLVKAAFLKVDQGKQAEITAAERVALAKFDASAVGISAQAHLKLAQEEFAKRSGPVFVQVVERVASQPVPQPMSKP